MKKYYLLGALALGLMTSCQNKDDVLNNLFPQSKVEATASLDLNSKSRTALQLDGESYKVVWSKNDAFSVFYGSPDAKSKFELQTGEGETTGIFESGNFKVSSGIESGPNGFAVVGYYPYSDATSVSKSGEDYVINAEIPVNQSYIENSFAQNASPMVAVTEGSLIFSFKNVASAFRVPLLGDKTIVKATLTASSKIAGPATVTAVSSDNWIPEVSIEDTKGSSTIVLSCGEGVELNSTEAKNFIFVLKPGTYPAGMVVKFYASDGTYYSYTTQGQQTFTRSIVTYINPKTYGTTGTGHDNGTAGIADANDALKAGVQNVDVTIATTDEDPTLKLPASTSENPTNINFETIPSGTTVTITASTESNNQEAKNVNLSVPASQEGYDFEINLPNSTVTLDANGESATYDDVTASTAEETLIISKNVTVNTLKIKKGHVRVHGTIGNISRDEENQDDVTYIIKEEGAVITGSITDEKIKVVSAAEYDLRKAIEKADANTTITLDNDVVLTSQLTITKNLTLNLNSKTISNTTDIWNDAEGIKTWSLISVQGEGVEVTITGEGTLNALKNDCYAVDVRDNATVNLENGTYVGNISAVYAINNATANIKGGTYSIQQLSTYQDYRYLLNLKDNSESSIVVTGGTFKNYDPANSNGENPIANLVASGYSSVADGDNYVVSEGIKNEEALIAAIASAETDATITLADDIVLSSQLTITKSLTLNLNSKTISNTTDIWNDAEGIKTWSLISVQGEGVEVTITGEGTLNALKNDCYAVDVRDNATVNLENGTYVGNISAVYAINNATANIKGGTYSIQQLSTYQDYRYLLNLKDSSESSIVVTGGTFYNFNPNNNQAEGTETNFVGEGYTVSETTENETNIYTVSKSEN